MRRSILLLPLLFAGRLWAADPQPASVPHLPVPLSNDWNSGTYLYDGSGNIKAIDIDRYSYDATGRLTYGPGARHSGSGQTYAYDAFGNMTSIDGGSGPSTLGVDPTTNRISLHTNPSNGVGYNTWADYDAAGNITSITGSVPSTYDAAGMMTQFRGGNYYLYTADDERIATRSSDGTLYSWTLRDASEKVLREYSETVANSGGIFTSIWIWKRDYVYRDGVLFAAVTPSGTSEVKQHYHVDHLGTPRLITDSGGVQKYAYDYFAFGRDAAFNAGDPEALHFTGHERDYESGTGAPNTDYLDYMHARYYSANLGRFLSVDPTLASVSQSAPQSWNRYAYVRDNPLNRTDPDGRGADNEAEFDRQMMNYVKNGVKPYWMYPEFQKAGFVVVQVMLAATIDAIFPIVPGVGSSEPVAPDEPTVTAAEGKMPTANPERVMQSGVRFFKKAPRGSENFKVETGKDGTKTFSYETPGKVPGSKAIYRKTVDASGEPAGAGVTKTTIDPKGNVVHVKDKLTTTPPKQ
jgi:RHS repeat-associated protein